MVFSSYETWSVITAPVHTNTVRGSQSTGTGDSLHMKIHKRPSSSPSPYLFNWQHLLGFRREAWLCLKRSYNKEVVGVGQSRPKAEFNSHFINLAPVYVNCFVKETISGKEETQSKPRVILRQSLLPVRLTRGRKFQNPGRFDGDQVSAAAKAARGYCTPRGWLGPERK